MYVYIQAHVTFSDCRLFLHMVRFSGKRRTCNVRMCVIYVPFPRPRACGTMQLLSLCFTLSLYSILPDAQGRGLCLLLRCVHIV